MRTVLFLLALIPVLCGTASACDCLMYGHAYDRSQRSLSNLHNNEFSSFRGISLDSSPREVGAVAAELGFGSQISTYLGKDASASSVDICNKDYVIVHADFDRDGQMIRLSLKDSFFYDAPGPVQDFAKTIFKRYRVKTTEVADDVCFQDITCFRGISKAGEQFLILRFGTVAELYVRRAGSIQGE